MKRLSLLIVLACICFGLAVEAGIPVKNGPVYVSESVVPTISRPIRDIPEYIQDPNSYGLEMARRNEWGFTGPNIQMPPHDNPLVDIQQRTTQPGMKSSKVFGTPLANFAGYTSTVSPPDTTGDVGLTYFVQGLNASTSIIDIYQKDGTHVQTIAMEDLADNGSNCANGYCDPVVMYDEIADRWVISEFASSGSYFCVYVSVTNDPTGSWYAYQFGSLGYSGPPDYPKYGVWPQDDDGDGNYDEGSYLIGCNAGSSGRDVYALDRGQMLQGLSATYQKFTATSLSAFGFQLLLPAGQEGANPPPNGEPAIFARPVDTELHDGYSCSPEPCDLMDLWALSVDWNTPSNSTFTHLPEVKITEFDQTLCGSSGNWNCMPQPGTTQKIDPIREPVHFPLQYRNFGDHQTIVGSFVEDTDGTDHAGVHWFELRKDTGDWYAVQDGVLGGESGVHRSVSSAAMDQAGDIAVGYTRTGDSTPYYPSIYYSGRLNSDTSGTMPYYDEKIYDATNSNTDNERWGDYSGMGVDPADGCTFWYTTEYGGNGNTRIAAFQFSECLCTTPGIPTGFSAVPNGDNRIDLSWSVGTPAGNTYNVYRAVGSCPQSSWTLIKSGVSGTSWSDTSASGGITYAYSVTAVDDSGNCESAKSSCDDAQTTGTCVTPPVFAGLESVITPNDATCELDLTWTAATPVCGSLVVYNIYRSESSGFTPGAANRIASCVSGTTYQDTDNLVNGTDYYYVVRAEDDSGNGSGPCAGGNEDTNSIEKSAAPYGPITVALDEDFEETGGEPTAGGAWSHSAAQGTDDWAQSTSGNPHSPTHTFFSSSVAELKDDYLVTPSFSVSSGATLSFYHTYFMESGFDGCVIEISTDGGSNWTDLGPQITTGGYTGTISTSYSSPIAGRNAWTGGAVGTETQVVVDLSPYAGQTAEIRFRLACDTSVAKTGWYIDDVVIQQQSSCTTAAACSVTLSPTSVDLTETGGSGTVSVTAGDCDWTAVSNDTWITVDSGSTGHGNGSVGYTVDSCSHGGSRTGTISIGDKTFTVNQTCGIDDVEPDTTITSTQCGGTIAVDSTTFTWTGTDNVTTTGNLVYSYRLDSESWSAWASDTEKTYSSISLGNHTFEVIARDEANNEDSSPASCSFNRITDPTPPTIPTLTQATASGDTSIDLTWSASTDAESGIDHYTVYGGASGPETTSGTSYTLTGLASGTEYNITVTATNGAGLESDPSNEECLTTTTSSMTPLSPCSSALVYPDSDPITFTFTQGSDTKWRVYVYGDAGLTTKVTTSKTRTKKWLSSAEWIPGGKKWGKILEGGATSGVVYWQVTGKLGGISPSRTLYIAPAAAAVPQTPTDGASAPDSTPATFTWDLNHNKKVQVEFSSTSDFSSGVEVTSKKNKPGKGWIKDVTWTAASGKWDKIKALGSTVYWRVHAKDALGRETYSSVFTLNITF